MQEDLAILETVFASRDAITGLQSLGKPSHEHNSSTSSAGTSDTTPSFKPGAHGRNLSSATGIDVPIIEDVLPVSEKKKKQEALARRFSRRGVRLAVHSSIMDTNAHDVPISLRNKWIQQAHLRRVPDHFNAGSPSIAQLSRISEVNSNAGADEPLPTIMLNRASTTSEDLKETNSPERSASQASAGSASLSHARMRSLSLVNSAMGKKLGGVITRLSRSSLHERKENAQSSSQAVEQDVYPSSEANDHGDREEKGKGKEVDVLAKKDMSAKEKPGWSYRLTRPFVKEPLATPDYERGF